MLTCLIISDDWWTFTINIADHVKFRTDCNKICKRFFSSFPFLFYRRETYLTTCIHLWIPWGWVYLSPASVCSFTVVFLSFSLGQGFLDRKEFPSTIWSSKPSTTVVTWTVRCQRLHYATIKTSDLITKCNNFISYWEDLLTKWTQAQRCHLATCLHGHGLMEKGAWWVTH